MHPVLLQLLPCLTVLVWTTENDGGYGSAGGSVMAGVAVGTGSSAM